GTRWSHFEYDPYGGQIVASDPGGLSHQFRFSTKFYQAAFGNYDFGRRYLHPKHGRWFSRDPIHELGGFALYAFARNQETTNIDPMGLVATWQPCDGDDEIEIEYEIVQACIRDIRFNDATVICCDGKCGAYIGDGFSTDAKVLECTRKHECLHCRQLAIGAKCGFNPKKQKKKCDDVTDGMMPGGEAPPQGDVQYGEPDRCECTAYSDSLKCIKTCKTTECRDTRCAWRCYKNYHCTYRDKIKATKESLQKCLDNCAQLTHPPK
ncbi:MAG: RHS repeat-associated core domain-containing protein, partial [Phycisphaerae bacterium]|nr:RHS repeat-associated core domain-containing protein [Phycisphaerae bacterium]